MQVVLSDKVSNFHHQFISQQRELSDTFALLTNYTNMLLYTYICINDTTSELSVFWPSDTESRINDLRFSESISLSFKTRLTSVTCFFGDVT